MSLSRQCCICVGRVHAQPWLFLPILLKKLAHKQHRLMLRWNIFPFYGKPVCPSAEGNHFAGGGRISHGLLLSHSSHAQEGARVQDHPLAGLLAAPRDPGFSHIPFPLKYPTEALSKPVCLLNGNTSQPKPVPLKIPGWL